MANLTKIPAIDDFETQLSSSYTWWLGTVSVNSVPSWTIESWETSYLVINPWKSNMQVVEVDWWNSGTSSFNVSNITIEKGNGVNYSAQTHAANSIVRFSNNYAFWKDIRTAVNSKASTDTSNTFTGTQTVANLVATGYIKDAVYADATARDAAIPTPSNGMVIYNTAVWLFQKYQAGAWVDDTSGASTPNASTTVAGKVEKSTRSEVTAGTSTGGTGAELFVWPAELKTVTDVINAQLATIPVSHFWWSSVDWAIDWTAAVTITWSNNTYIVKNYSSWVAWTAARICTVTPTWCVVHIKIKWNADFTNRTFNFAGKWWPWGAIWTNWTSTSVILAPANTWWITVWWSWPWWASWINNGTAIWWSGTWWVHWWTYTLTNTVMWRRLIEMSPWSWWAGGNDAWVWWAGGWCLIIEVWWNLTVNSWSTSITAAWVNWSNSAANYWWGWWGWWMVLVMYWWTLTWTVTPVVTWGTWGTWPTAAWWVWGAWEYVFTKNYMF